MNYFSLIYKKIMNTKLFFLILFALLSINIVFAQSDSLKKSLEIQLNTIMQDEQINPDLILKQKIRLDSLVLIHSQLDSIVSKLSNLNRRICSESMIINSFSISFLKNEKDSLYMEIVERGSDVFFDRMYYIRGYKLNPYGYFKYNGCTFYIVNYQDSDKINDLTSFFKQMNNTIVLEEKKSNPDSSIFIYENAGWFYLYEQNKFKLISSYNTEKIDGWDNVPSCTYGSLKKTKKDYCKIKRQRSTIKSNK